MHFISGLPRSGTTLLAALLRQNSQIHTGIISPAGQICQQLYGALSPVDETHFFLKETDRERILRSAISAVHRTDKMYVFDNNRFWASKIPLMTRLYPDAKFFILLRPIEEIMDSFERIFREHPAECSKIYGLAPGATVYERSNAMCSGQGVIGFAWNAVREAWALEPENVVFWEYDNFVREPAAHMKQLHEFCGIPPFDYNPHKVEQIPDVEAFDRMLGAPGLHTVGSIIRPHEYVRKLPADLYPTFAQPFWR